MKRILITLFAIAAMASTLSAQAPKGFNYQLVVRNNAGLLVANHNVSVHLQIVQGSPTGTKVYELNDNYMTNANGLVTLVVGENSASYAAINWANGPYYIVSEVDPNGGSNYTLRTAQQILAVPYAEYSQHAAIADSVNGASENDPKFAAWFASWGYDYDSLVNTPQFLSDFTNDLNFLTENDLLLTLSGDTLCINGVSCVVLPKTTKVDWDSVVNHPTHLSQFTNDLNFEWDSIVNRPDSLSQFINNITIDWDSIVNRPTNLNQLISNLNVEWDSVINHPTHLSQFTNDLNLEWDSIINRPTNLSQFNNDLALNFSGDTLYVGGNTVVIPNPIWDSIQNRPDSLSQFINNITIEWDSIINRPTFGATETQDLQSVLSFGNDAAGNIITGLANPTVDSDAANKYYVDSRIALEAARADARIDSLDTAMNNALNTAIAGSTPYLDNRIDSLQDAINSLLDSINNLHITINNYSDSLDSINNAHQNVLDSIRGIIADEKHYAIDGELNGIFSVSTTEKVRFSKGNLQYRPNIDTWRFAENQFSTSNSDNNYVSMVQYCPYWIDLFGYGTSNWKGSGNTYQPWSYSPIHSDYSESTDGDDLIGMHANADWGFFNPIINGGNQMGVWRTLTYNEWTYIITERPNATNLRGLATIAGVSGLIILPDEWSNPAGLAAFNNSMSAYSDNAYTVTTWNIMEAAGAVFLPAAGYRLGMTTTTTASEGYYWSTTHVDGDKSWSVKITSSSSTLNQTYASQGCSVRLVRDYKE